MLIISFFLGLFFAIVSITTEDHYFRLEMHHNIFYGMGMVLGEIWDKQASGKPILPIKNTGMWEIINAGDWMYEYEGYERSADKKSCEVKK
mmetsp:Transcript_45022/g.66854  ORF Transcript_45022/g.66854 Transcript_45022/m.66854 type:complete len:91 (+) Transcript_45022:68-340(+)